MLYRRNYITYRFFDAFFRNWLLFLLAVVVVSGVVGAALVLRSASYVANSSIRVIGDSEVSNALGIQQQDWQSPSQRNINHFNDLMQNVLPGGFVDNTLRKADLVRPISVDPQKTDPRFAQFRRSVYGKTDSGDVFTIGLVWDDKLECERLVRALQQEYIAEAGLARQTSAVAITQFLNKKIADYKQRLQKAELALINYKSTHFGQLPDAQAAEISQYSNLSQERDYLGITAQDNSLRRADLEARLNRIKPTSILEQTIGSDPLRLQLRGLEARRADYINRGYLPISTLVKNVDQRIVEVRARIATQAAADPQNSRNVTETRLQDNPEYLDVNQQLSDAKSAERQQKARLSNLNSQIASYEDRIRRLPAAERELTEKTRDYTILKEAFEALLQRREQANLKADVDKVTATSTLAVQNEIYAEPTLGARKKQAMLAASVLLGIIIASLMLILREWIDPSLRYEEDASRLLGVPVLASLPESRDLRFPEIQPRGLLRRRIVGSLNPEVGRAAALASNGASEQAASS